MRDPMKRLERLTAATHITRFIGTKPATWRGLPCNDGHGRHLHDQSVVEAVRRLHATGSYSYRELARMAGCSVASAWRWCRSDKHRQPTRRLVARYRRAPL